MGDDATDRVQVIATNAAALWPQVKNEAFSEAPYYRLNVIYIDLTTERTIAAITLSR